MLRVINGLMKMAAPLRKTRQDEIRTKIGVAMIMSRLEKHIAGTVELSATQIQAASILLKKAVPDLSAVEMNHSGSVDIGLAALREMNERS